MSQIILYQFLGDGIVEKSSSKRGRKSVVTEERELVRNLDDRFQFDIDSGNLIKKKRDDIHKMKGDLSYMFSQKDAKNVSAYFCL